jgi:PKD repeat protein
VHFDGPAYSKAALELAVYSGVASVGPVAPSGDGGQTAHTTPVVTAPAGALVLSLWTDKSQAVTAWTAPGGVTVRDTAVGTGGGRYGVLLADSGAAVTGGSYGGLTATTDAADTRAAMWTMALVPSTTGQQNEPPVADFTTSCTALSCSFDGSGSHDPDGTIASYAWQFGDGDTAAGATATHTFAGSGTYPVTLTVTDDGGLTGTATQQVTVTSGTSQPVTFVAAAHGPGGSVRTEQVSVPAASGAGDLAVLVLTAATTSTWSGPSGLTGWTQLSSSTQGTVVSTVWTRTLAAGDSGAAVHFDSAAYGKAALELAVYSGVGSVGPVAAAGDSGQTAHTTPLVTAPAGALVLSLWTDKSQAVTAWTAPAGVTVRDSAVGTGGGRYGVLVADSGAPIAAGSYGGLTATTDAADTHAVQWTLALLPS